MSLLSNQLKLIQAIELSATFGEKCEWKKSNPIRRNEWKMHRIEVMCDYTITISGAVCANVRKKLSLSSSRSLFFSSHDSLRRSSHHVRGRVRCACYTFLQFMYQCYLLVMLCNCTELLILHQNQAFEFLSARSICSCQFVISISRFLVQLFYHKFDDVKHDWMNESNDLILLTCACD